MPAQLIADTGMMWTCASCGVRSFNHHECCDGCGKERPEPPPEKEPSKVPREETMPGFMFGEGWMLCAGWTEAEIAAVRKLVRPVIWTRGEITGPLRDKFQIKD